MKYVFCKKIRFLRNCRLIDWIAIKFVMFLKTSLEVSRMNFVSVFIEKIVTFGFDNSFGYFVYVERVKFFKARFIARLFVR